ncbi:hypothetical protein FDP41_006325 [Naegleria fowleri]|uniref:histidine kinase n=1 Tax=Naegleria fowleri TaxID=5763 RepID=A0A6A5BKG3_NAEFO|nr:uncharacterized protein FDP41_006325 [Naegleria fowleri]KAF0974851.1 hypothetical protein FDP41_006325 [Naegleria fowleri]
MTSEDHHHSATKHTNSRKSLECQQHSTEKHNHALNTCTSSKLANNALFKQAFCDDDDDDDVLRNILNETSSESSKDFLSKITRNWILSTTCTAILPYAVTIQFSMMFLFSLKYLSWISSLILFSTFVLGLPILFKYRSITSGDNTVPTEEIYKQEKTFIKIALVLFIIRFILLRQHKILLIPYFFLFVMQTTKFTRHSVKWSLVPTYIACVLFVLDFICNICWQGWHDNTIRVLTEDVSLIMATFLFGFSTITTGIDLRSKVRSLEQTSKQLEEALNTKQTFLRHISHEFRTPCLSSLGSVELLKETSLTDYQRDLVETIASADGILLNLIEDILTLAKIEHEKKLEEKEEIVDTSKYVQEFSLGHCVKMIGNIIKSYSTQFNVNVLVKIDDVTKDIVVRANQTRIHQIISNLMTNAVKASKSGDDVELICETNCNEKKLVNGVMEQDVIFKVKDRGVGIPKEKQQVIFEPFSQLHNVNESIYPSSGLGLNTVLHNVTSMRGTIHLESEVGKEDRVRSRLFPKKQLSAQANYLKLFASAEQTISSKSNAKIIVADDNAINRKVIVKLIESLGFDADAVCDGKQLIEHIDGKRHKLVITDINMPNLNGIEATRIIRERFKDKIKVVALTGDALACTPQSLPPSLFDSVIVKPCHKATLKQCIDSISFED